MGKVKILADKAARLCRRNPSLKPYLAAVKVVRGQGITRESDVKRLARAICSELGKRGGNKTACKKVRARVAQELHERIAP